LGIAIGETSVANYMARRRKPPSQTWRTFLNNHVKTLVSVDFLTLPTICFQAVSLFLLLAQSPEKDSPEPQNVQPPELGRVVAVPQVGELHHRYEGRAA
jgi:hypothetical protein